MLKDKIIYKVLAIITVTMLVGFSTLGILAIWIEFRSTMDLQAGNSRILSAVITKSITDLMVQGEAQKIDTYFRELKEKHIVSGLKIFNTEGKG